MNVHMSGQALLSVYISQRLLKRKSAAWKSRYASLCRAGTVHRQTALGKWFYVESFLFLKLIRDTNTLQVYLTQRVVAAFSNRHTCDPNPHQM